ncbi:MAG: NTPase, partial [Candidatus Bathyarchaeia archaeon]
MVLKMNVCLTRVIFVTGKPGVGKSTLIRKVSEKIKERGYSVGGMLTTEIREDGVRVGFSIIDLESGRMGILAHIRQDEGPRIGKYKVNLNDLDSVGVKSVENAVEKADVVFIDEVGPMELKSRRFFEALMKAVSSSKPLVATVHHSLTESFISNLKLKGGVEV